MFKTIQIIVLATLCLNFTTEARQVQSNPSLIQPLKVGDKIPDEIWNMPLRVVNHPKGKETITLNDYKGKLIILDFWDKFCGSCIAAMPKMAALQKQFATDVIIINVTVDNPKDASTCLTTNKMIKDLNLFSVAGDEVLNKLFPHRTIPHYIWISKDQAYLSQAASRFMLPENINKVLKGGSPDWQEKNDVDTKKPLFLGDKLPPDVKLGSYTIFVEGRVTGLGGGVGSNDYTGRDKFYKNYPLIDIYKLLANKVASSGANNKRIINEVPADDKLYDINKRYTFHYVCDPDQSALLYEKALEALNNASDYYGRMEKRKVKHYILVRTDTKDRLKTKGGTPMNNFSENGGRIINCPISYLANRLNGAEIDEPFVLDSTGYTGKVDITLKSPLTDFPAIRRELRDYGLDLVLVDQPAEVFVISKQKAVSPSNP